MFDWTLLLEVAEHLAKRGDEQYERSSISRAYYACFHSARDWLNERGEYKNPSRHKDHEYVWNTFSSAAKKVGRDWLAKHDPDYDAKIYTGIGDTNRIWQRIEDLVPKADRKKNIPLRIRDLCREGRQLRDIRRKADYDAVFDGHLKKTVVSTMFRAQRIVRLLASA